ncbi:sensor histidine kinase [Ruania rhizosphaerae]|uniref:sensor histidine kinase n=1 Tax=Ruania rhizosphaerae TaxID=1840413 RepID=UPI00135833C7|nr:HAMP domain-containing sensor histidine kinase [Ruania rhizosphaerae]
MTIQHRSLATRIAVSSAAILTAISGLVLVAEWIVLTSVATSSVTVDQPDAEAAPEVVEAVYQLTSGTIITTMLVTAVALLAIIATGTIVSYRAARISLRRVADISAHTRRITASTLDERLDLDGPHDEIKDLADTIDDTLGQLDDAFSQQERFAANASHELRTPLAVLRTSLESLSARDDLHEDDDLQRSVRSTRRVQAILDSLLVLAQTKLLPPERRFPVDLSTTVGVAFEDHAHAFVERDIHTVVDIDGDVNTSGDQTLLLQAVHNLLHNAARYTPPGGNAHVIVTNDEHSALVTVTNDGDVFTSAEASRLTEPFNRGTDSRLNRSPGHGLGLSIVNSIVRQHGGTFTITANANGGITAAIRLPATESGARGESPTPTSPQASTRT